MIRKMTKEDIPEIVKSENRIFGDSLGEGMLINELSNPLAHYFVLDIDNFVAGYIGLWADLSCAQILNFYIHEDFRRKGYGTMLLNYGIDILYSLGVNTISLEVRPSNFNALDLYENLGFEFSHIRKYYYNDGEDAHVLIKRKD